MEFLIHRYDPHPVGHKPQVPTSYNPRGGTKFMPHLCAVPAVAETLRPPLTPRCVHAPRAGRRRGRSPRTAGEEGSRPSMPIPVAPSTRARIVRPLLALDILFHLPPLV